MSLGGPGSYHKAEEFLAVPFLGNVGGAHREADGPAVGFID